MSSGEIRYRVAQQFSNRIEQLKLRRGWTPAVADGDFHFSRFFDDTFRLPAAAAPRADNAALARGLLSGHLQLFDYPALNVGWPINWHVDPLTGTRSPADQYGKAIDYRDDKLVGDIKVLWELGRQQFLVPLAINYGTHADDDSLRTIEGVLNSWIQQNPYGYGIHWCSSLEVAIRGMSWACCHQILLAAGLPEGLFSLRIDSRQLRQHIVWHARFIRGHLSLYSSANNHLIGELTGLHFLTAAFHWGARSDAWREFAWQQLLREADAQVHPDGVDKEQAIYYHCWVLEYLIINYAIASRWRRDIPGSLAQRLTAMARFVVDLCPGPAGTPPQIGDADDGIAIDFGRCGAATYFRELIDAVDALAGGMVPEAGSKAFWYAALLNRETTTRPEAVTKSRYPASYPQGGYAILGSPDFHAVFDCGPLGYPSIAAHGHADMLNICLAVEGLWWLIDPGTYAYHSDPRWRNYFRGSRAHNVLTIREQDQSEIGGPFMWVRHAGHHFAGVRREGPVQHASGWHDGYRSLGVARVSREVAIDSEQRSLCISDTVMCDAPVAASLGFHFAPQVQIERQEGCEVVLARPDSDVRLLLSLPEGADVKFYQGDEESPSGWYSSALGQKQPCLTIRAGIKMTITKSLVTTLRLANPSR